PARALARAGGLPRHLLEPAVPVPSFPLTSEPWIEVRDADVGAYRRVGITEALTRAHRLSFDVARAGEVPVMRLLAAVYDAAAGPRDAAEWDAAWAAPALDEDRITAYLKRWEHRLDLVHPTHPAFQCGELDIETACNMGAEALNPSRLGGASGPWFDHRLRQAEHPPFPWREAAANLLFLLAYDGAGIKRAAPGDPAENGGKVFGAATGLTAAVTHVHVETGRSLKDLLLLSLPPQPRAPGDAPVWERDTPPAPVRERQPTGRLDILTWPARRIRLRPDGDGMVRRVAFYDGDRLPDRTQTLHTLRELDPMTGWGTTAKGAPAPRSLTDHQSVVLPWSAAGLLREDAASPVLDHVVQAAERGALDPGLPLRVVMSGTTYSNKHLAVISAQPQLSTLLGTAGALARPEVRDALARAAGTPWVFQKAMVKAVLEVTGPYLRDMVTAKLRLWDLDGAWHETIEQAADDPDAARARWWKALDELMMQRLEEVPLKPTQREKARAAYRRLIAEDSATVEERKPARRRGRKPGAVETFEVFGGTYTLSQISRLPQCQVSYPTLRKRVTVDGWNIEEAATTPTRRGPGPKPPVDQ
ncbi:type I-E CRISPR-associated protein Cse1/CasA, partial [Streptomyces sp. DH12]|uniref:type I-E CRISPR-associated protein Cse1/CasA n=1 Tax=Streptomyces sp. DH12 TaxID=2857010 RepID=UPI001E3D8D6A